MRDAEDNFFHLYLALEEHTARIQQDQASQQSQDKMGVIAQPRLIESLDLFPIRAG